jgi:hypothetical protein
MIKIIVVLALLGGLGWFISDYIGTKQDNAVLDATLSSTTKAFGDYATNVESEVEAWRQNFLMVNQDYQNARDERDEDFASIENRDLNKIHKRRPEVLARILTGRTNRLLDDIGSSGRDSRNSGSPSTPKTRTD